MLLLTFDLKYFCPLLLYAMGKGGGGQMVVDDFCMIYLGFVKLLLKCLWLDMVSSFSAAVVVIHSEALGCLICPILPQCLNVPRGQGISRH